MLFCYFSFLLIYYKIHCCLLNKGIITLCFFFILKLATPLVPRPDSWLLQKSHFYVAPAVTSRLICCSGRLYIITMLLLIFTLNKKHSYETCYWVSHKALYWMQSNTRCFSFQPKQNCCVEGKELSLLDRNPNSIEWKNPSAGSFWRHGNSMTFTDVLQSFCNFQCFYSLHM